MAVGLVAGCGSADPDPSLFVDPSVLDPDVRVYDETGESLTNAEVTDLEARLAALGDIGDVGADAIVYVRALDVDSEATLDQVEALQQAWVAETGVDQDIAVAFLINRNPDDATDARAGIFVGSTFDDGNVPRGEQVEIINDEVIPPLRDGAVYTGLVHGIDRLGNSIENGPSTNAFEDFADDAGRTWYPWAGVGAAAVLGVISLLVFRRRPKSDRDEMPPTTLRPSHDLSPGLAGGLVGGGPQASVVPATLLALAARDALDIEPESDGGTFSKPKIQVRLLDESLITDDIERALWNELDERSADGVVSSKDLAKLAQKSKPVRDVVEAQMASHRWLDPRTNAKRAPLLAVAIVAIGLGIVSIVLASVGGHVAVVFAVVALFLVGMASIIFLVMFSKLSPAGADAAVPWKAYSDGLKKAAKDDAVVLDLDAVLVDATAMNLGRHLGDRLEAANENGEAIRAFTSQNNANTLVFATFPWWIAFNSVVTTSSGAGGASGAGAGGGGGAAGST